MKLSISTTTKETIIKVDELKHDDKKQFNSMLLALNNCYTYYMTDNTLVHFNGWLKNTSLETYDFYTFVKQFQEKELKL